MADVLWQPDAERIARANLTAFARLATQQYRAPADDYAALWRWSVERREEFWPAVWDFAGVQASRTWDNVLVGGDRLPGAHWFPGARLNFAENLLRRRDDSPAAIFWNEAGPQRTVSWSQLYGDVARLACALRERGIGPGDRVAAFLPNMPETLVAMLAASSLGAVFSSCSPDFGVAGVLDRFRQIEPRVLLAVDRSTYAQKTHDTLPRVREIAAGLPTLEHTIIVGEASDARDLASLPDPVRFADLVSGPAPPLEFVQLPFDHPLYILYSSGTTGVPKCIVHGQGGTLLQHLKEHLLHVDVHPGSRLFYFTTTGWMMWNWLATALASQATLILYDGSPFHPQAASLWELARAESIEVFGASAKYFSALEKAEVRPAATHSLPALRTILSTGSPLLAESYDYIYRDVKPDVALASISGGTDLVSCFALGNPWSPVWHGELSCRGLGMNVEVFDEAGRPLVDEKGELVCTRAFPSMPVRFWNDPDGSKYHNAYFARYPNVWHHGDWAELTERGSLLITGRSDATLNPGGVRIGTAEIYRLVEQLPEILESLVVGQDWEGDVRIVLFVRLRDGASLDEPLRSRIRQEIRAGASPRHVPARIVAVNDIPRTKSGKIVELAVRHVLHGRPVTNLNALANPEALDQFRDLPELKR